MNDKTRGVVTIGNTGVALHFDSPIQAEATFNSMRNAIDAPHMTLWVKNHSGRCDFIVFTPNGG